jgi:SAM-dependent methyltransferase
MVQTVEPWCYRCPQCSTWGSTLDVGINGAGHANLDEGLRETGLAVLREANNEIIMRRLAQLGAPEGARLLDVGSAHGWFVRAARARGFEAEGIEPDTEVAKLSAANGVEPVHGLFPDALPAGRLYDVITFNDVLEHIPDVPGILGAVHDRLRPGGLLSVNIPNSQGIVYRTSVVAARMGVRSVFERLWQVGLPSPHLWFFHESGLTRLVTSLGFERRFAGRLPSITRNGIWQRAHADRRPTPLTVGSVAVGWAAAPLLNNERNSDIMHLVFARQG